MSANLKNRVLKESVVNGFTQYTMTDTYQITTSRTTGPVTSLSITGLPARGSSTVVDGVTLWLRDRDLQIPNPTDAATDRFVICTWTNNTQSFKHDDSGDPVATPNLEADYVVFDSVNYTEPINDAKLIGITYGVPYGPSNTSLIASPGWLTANRVGTVTNSAGKPVLVERQNSHEKITVWRTVRDWDNNWDDYENSINSDGVTITQTDIDGTRLTKSYGIDCLRMEKVHKRDFRREGKLYFQVGFEMVYNKRSWIHSEVDRGTERRAFVGQSKPDGGEYDQNDLNELGIGGNWGYASIMTDDNTVAIGEPVKLNGTGAEMPLDRLDDVAYNNTGEFFLNYYVNERKAFSPLVSPS